jgi:small subunit ribosomal protein S7
MSRKNKLYNKVVSPDATFSSQLVTLLVNKILKAGKKTLAQKIVYKALDRIQTKTQSNPVLVLEKAVKNVMPRVELKTKRHRKSRHLVPVEIRTVRGVNISLKWISGVVSSRSSGKSASEKLANELFAASNQTGNAIRKRDELLKLAKAHKTFARFK